MSVHIFMMIHPVFVEICQSGPVRSVEVSNRHTAAGMVLFWPPRVGKTFFRPQGVFMRIMKEGQGCKDQPNFYFHPPSFSITRRQICSFSYLRNVNSPVRISFCWSNRTTGVTSTQLKETYLRGFTKIRSRNLEFRSTHLLLSDATLQNSPKK